MGNFDFIPEKDSGLRPEKNSQEKSSIKQSTNNTVNDLLDLKPAIQAEIMPKSIRNQRM